MSHQQKYVRDDCVLCTTQTLLIIIKYNRLSIVWFRYIKTNETKWHENSIIYHVIVDSKYNSFLLRINVLFSKFVSDWCTVSTKPVINRSYTIQWNQSTLIEFPISYLTEPLINLIWKAKQFRIENRLIKDRCAWLHGSIISLPLNFLTTNLSNDAANNKAIEAKLSWIQLQPMTTDRFPCIPFCTCRNAYI